MLPRSVNVAVRARFARELTHPLPLAAVLLLAVNDHLLKGSGILPSWLTGKLSDFAGLFFFPLLSVALLRIVVGERARVEWAIAATWVVFTALKTSTGFAAEMSEVWGPIVCDPTDLLALPMLGLAAWWARRFR